MPQAVPTGFEKATLDFSVPFLRAASLDAALDVVGICMETDGRFNPSSLRARDRVPPVRRASSGSCRLLKIPLENSPKGAFDLVGFSSVRGASELGLTGFEANLAEDARREA